MKKRNEKGFVLMETLIVSVFIMTLLVFLFVQFRKIASSYNTTFQYNTVNGLYSAESVSTFLNQDGYEDLASALRTAEADERYYIDIVDCPSAYFNEKNYCDQLFQNLKIVHAYFMSSNMNNFISKLDFYDDMSENTKDFARYVKSDTNDAQHRLVIEFENNEFATVKLGKKSMVSSRFNFTGDVQTFRAPKKGTYRVELWGAQGGNANASMGRGAYTSGLIELNAGETIYVYVGGAGTAPIKDRATYTGGYNGGGNGGAGTNTGGSGGSGGSGGGATDIRLTKGVWNDAMSLRSRIMVAAGGGAAGGIGATNSSMEGGAAGGLSGYPFTAATTPGVYSGTPGTGGSQTAGGVGGFGNSAGGAQNTLRGLNGTFGVGGNAVATSFSGAGGGAGGGYYGGGAGGSADNGHGAGGGGGSSFISGYAGSIAVDTNGKATGQSVHFSNKVFINGNIIAGNALMPSTNGSGNMTGNSGNGKAFITFIMNG